MLLKDVVEKTSRFFKDKKIESARLDTELLIAAALGIRRIDVYLKYDQPLKEQEIEKCRDFVRRRALGEPVAYILNQKDFYNLSFFVDARVLVPRPETEQIVELALEWMKNKNQESYNVLDLGCGSGCIGLSIAKFGLNSRVTLIDKSEGATEVTKVNQNNLELLERTNILHQDVKDFKLTDIEFDIIVGNPPYIDREDKEIQESVKTFEPHEALFANNFGLEEIFEWSRLTSRSLKNPGLMIFEIGASQGKQAEKHFNSLEVFSKVKVLKDLSGFDRLIVGEKNG